MQIYYAITFEQLQKPCHFKRYSLIGNNWCLHPDNKGYVQNRPPCIEDICPIIDECNKIDMNWCMEMIKKIIEENVYDTLTPKEDI